MKRVNLQETISHIHLSLKPERKQQQHKTIVLPPTKPMVFPKVSIEDIATWGSTREDPIPTGFFNEGPSNVSSHWHIGLLTVCLNYSSRNFQASANQTPMHDAFCWSWPKFQHVDQSVARNPWTNFQNEWPIDHPIVRRAMSKRSEPEGLELEWNVVRIFSNTFQYHLGCFCWNTSLKWFTVAQKKHFFLWFLYHIDHLVVAFNPYFKPNMRKPWTKMVWNPWPSYTVFSLHQFQMGTFVWPWQNNPDQNKELFWVIFDHIFTNLDFPEIARTFHMAPESYHFGDFCHSYLGSQRNDV